MNEKADVVHKALLKELENTEHRLAVLRGFVKSIGATDFTEAVALLNRQIEALAALESALSSRLSNFGDHEDLFSALPLRYYLDQRPEIKQSEPCDHLKSRIEAFEKDDQPPRQPWEPLEFPQICYEVNGDRMNECMNALQRAINPSIEYVPDELTMTRNAVAISQKAAKEAEDTLIRAIPGWFLLQSKGSSPNYTDTAERPCD